MFCPNCGTPVQGSFCPQCGTSCASQPTSGTTPQGYQAPQGYQVPQGFQPSVASPLVWSILSTICCCLPFGIVSIVYAAKVNSLNASGNYQQAKEAADKAKMWAWLSFGIGLICNILYILVNIAMQQQSGMYY